MDQIGLMRRTVRLPAVLAIATIAFVAAAAGWFAAGMRQQQPAEIETTIQQIRARPADFSGRSVRLTGKLDECYRWECSICPETMTGKDRDSDRCLAVGFRPLVSGTGFGVTEQENLFRFSSVILTATFDPSCWKGGCLDRQVVLQDATVVAVTKRRPGASGLWLTDRTDLNQLNDSIAKEMRSAALRASYSGDASLASPTPPIRAFASVEPKRRFIICWSPSAFDGNEPGTWPATLENALYAQSTRDFFKCNEVRRVGREMVVQIEE